MGKMSSVNKELQKFSIEMRLISGSDFPVTLRPFSEMIASCVGPKGKVKLIQSEGGIEILTTSSKRLLQWIEIDCPVLQVISNSMKGQWEMYNDFGLLTGLISSYLLIDASNYLVPFTKMSKLVKVMSSVSSSLLQSSNIEIKVDFSSLKQLLQIVRAIITSKPLCGKSTLIDVEALCFSIVKGFLHGFSQESSCLGSVSVLVEEGPSSEPPTTFPGVLYALPANGGEEEYHWRVPSNCAKKKLLVVLFTDNLSTSCQHCNYTDVVLAEGCIEIQNQVILERIEVICQKLLAAGVSVFACQKVIHPVTQLFLRRNGALVLERMGKELADSFAVLSDAVPIADINIEAVPEDWIGEIEAIEHITKGHKSYLLLKQENHLKDVATILAFVPGEQMVAELKVSIHQSLQSLCHLVSHPFVYPGSGCLEVWLAEELQSSILKEMDEICKEYQCNKFEVLSVLFWFRSTFLRVSNHITRFSGPITIMDSVYHHCWSKVESNSCNCGLVNKNSLEDIGTEWSFIEIDVIKEKIDIMCSLKKLEEMKCNGSSFISKKTLEANISNEKQIKKND
ncbi:hypothetical protein J437_LFUL009343 [Ladona fulva]|uniref:Uncharacterized protein n=1 Tax=Ladona fulva TaxID=123851 RepID=A0A8K0K9Q0_LADFU|nr:hypothetical protein J437_LFUL009343 [Ladona fulva]